MLKDCQKIFKTDFQEYIICMVDNILIIDDCNQTRSLLKDILLKTKITKNVIEADNGIIGLIKAKNQKFDLIIVDHQMPKRSGIDLVIDLITIKAYKPEELVVVSGFLSSEDVSRLINANVKNIFSKPIQINRFVNLISFNDVN